MLAMQFLQVSVGIFVGVIGNDFCKEKWFVGSYYAKMWGIAFAGAPMAQVLLELRYKTHVGANAAQWRDAMTQRAGYL